MRTGPSALPVTSALLVPAPNWKDWAALDAVDCKLTPVTSNEAIATVSEKDRVSCSVFIFKSKLDNVGLVWSATKLEAASAFADKMAAEGSVAKLSTSPALARRYVLAVLVVNVGISFLMLFRSASVSVKRTTVFCAWAELLPPVSVYSAVGAREFCKVARPGSNVATSTDSENVMASTPWFMSNENDNISGPVELPVNEAASRACSSVMAVTGLALVSVRAFEVRLIYVVAPELAMALFSLIVFSSRAESVRVTITAELAFWGVEFAKARLCVAFCEFWRVILLGSNDVRSMVSEKVNSSVPVAKENEYEAKAGLVVSAVKAEACKAALLTMAKTGVPP
eukprot:m.856527 g.856527  ORF g.856527 m.856527 type:complete len:340 (+) comp59635_c1_seq3:1-1020(+)